MVTQEIQSAIEAIEQHAALYEETNFGGRVEAIDYIEFHVIDRIDGRLQTKQPSEELIRLIQYAESVKRRLEHIDAALFRRLRTDIRGGACTGAALKALIDTYVGCDSSGGRQQNQIGYDSLDVFVNRLLLSQAAPIEERVREPEMVSYQPTPARIIFEMVEQAQLTGEDVFYDLGSGLGHVPILVNLLSGATAKGVEFEPAYCRYASDCAAVLNLSDVAFINVDARTADYSEGTVFFMYTPFEGDILREVLEKLRGESRKRRISLCTYGPCTPQVSQQSWLMCVNQKGDQIDKLGAFSSL